MSALTDLFTSLANKIRSKTGGSDTYTPTEMVDAIDDVYTAGYNANSYTFTPSSTPYLMHRNYKYKPTADAAAVEAPIPALVPSNAYPDEITNGDFFIAQGSGLAIASITNLTPSDSTPATISSGTIYKATAAGKAVENVYPITPSTSNPPPLRVGMIVNPTASGFGLPGEEEDYLKHPSNSTPTAISSAEWVLASGSGYFINSYDSVTPTATPEFVDSGDIVKLGGGGVIMTGPDGILPSNSYPAALTSGAVLEMQGSGYAIESYSSVTPSDSSPVSLASGTIYKASAGGYAIESNPTSVTPDVVPVALTSGGIYKMGANGKAVANIENLTPSDSSPAAIQYGHTYYLSGGVSGYAIISSPTVVTPTANTQRITAGIKKIAGNGYISLYPKFPYKKSGTLEDFTSNNQEQSVDTGLTEIKYFYVEGTSNNNANLGSAWLDTDRPFAKQVATYSTTSATQAVNSGSGTTITANSAALKISGISDGTVTVKSGNAASYQYKNVKWYAG